MKIAGSIIALGCIGVVLHSTGVVTTENVASLWPAGLTEQIAEAVGFGTKQAAPAVAAAPVQGCDRPGCPIEVVRTVSEAPANPLTVVTTTATTAQVIVPPTPRPSERTETARASTEAPRVLTAAQPAVAVDAVPQAVPTAPTPRQPQTQPQSQAQPRQAAPAQPRKLAAHAPARIQNVQRNRPETQSQIGATPEWTRRQVFNREG